MILGVILARSGSKRLPGKNTRKLGGYTLVELAIKQASAVPKITYLILSSDSDEILDTGMNYGIQVVKRPKSLAEDASRSEAGVLHAVKSFLLMDENPTLILLQPTSPLRTSGDISCALKQFEDSKPLSLVSVDEKYQPNGAIYITSYKTLQSFNTFYPPGWEKYIMPNSRSLDIDDQDDWKEAEETLFGKQTLDWDG